MLQAGVAMAFGSDWPVIDPEALQAVYAAVHRRRPDLTSPGLAGVVPEESITAAEALQAYTIDAARMAGLDNILGSLSCALPELLII